jgi:Na+-driven multidrug efflux pump
VYQPVKKINERIILSMVDPDERHTEENDDSDEKKEDQEDEHYRLGHRPPLKTLLALTVGPLISQVVSAIYGVVTSMWMARAMGDLGMAAISVFANLDSIGRAFGFFLMCAATSKISALFGEHRDSEAGQVVCDLWRLTFVCGAIVPGILIPVAKPLARWYGSEPDVVHYSFLYLAPLSGCAAITCIYLLMCGCLQAEGRSLLVGGIQIASLILNMCALNPLFLLVFKWDTIGAAMATIVSELIPAIVLTVLYFRGRFGVKPDWRGLFKRFSPDTLPAVRIGISQLIMQISRSVPSILTRKYMGLCAEHNPDASFQDAVSGFNAVVRIYTIAESVRYAVSMGMLPAISYAFTSNQPTRIFWIIFHASWIDFVWGGSTCIATAFAARYIAMSISTSEAYLKWATPMMKVMNWEAPYAWIRNIVQTTLQGLQYGLTATVYSFCSTFFAMVGAVMLMYYTNNADFVRLMYSYPITSAFSVVVGAFVIILPLRRLKKPPQPEEGVVLEEVIDNEDIDGQLLHGSAIVHEGNK